MPTTEELIQQAESESDTGDLIKQAEAETSSRVQLEKSPSGMTLKDVWETTPLYSGIQMVKNLPSDIWDLTAPVRHPIQAITGVVKIALGEGELLREKLAGGPEGLAKIEANLKEKRARMNIPEPSAPTPEQQANIAAVKAAAAGTNQSIEDFVVRNIEDPMGIPFRLKKYIEEKPASSFLMATGAAGAGRILAAKTGMEGAAAILGTVEKLPSTVLSAGIGAIKSGKFATTLTSVDTSLNKVILKHASKGFGVYGNTPNLVKKYFSDMKETVSSIIKNKDNLQIHDVTGEARPSGSLPRNGAEAIDAVTQRMRNVWSQVDEIHTNAIGHGVIVPTDTAVAALTKMANDRAILYNNPPLARYAARVAETMKDAKSFTVNEMQRTLSSFDELQQVYLHNPSVPTFTRVAVEAVKIREFKKALDIAVDTYGHQALKSEYGALARSTPPILKQAKKKLSAPARGLMDAVDIYASNEALLGLFSGRGYLIAASTGSKFIASAIKYMRSPDRAIKKLFKEAAPLVEKKVRLTPAAPKVSSKPGLLQEGAYPMPEGETALKQITGANPNIKQIGAPSEFEMAETGNIPRQLRGGPIPGQKQLTAGNKFEMAETGNIPRQLRGGPIPGQKQLTAGNKFEMRGPDLVATLKEKLANLRRSKALPRRADGGPVKKQGAYWVGEKGPEVFVPDESGTVYPANKLPPMDRDASPEQKAEQWRTKFQSSINKTPTPSIYNPNERTTKFSNAAEWYNSLNLKDKATIIYKLGTASPQTKRAMLELYFEKFNETGLIE